MKLRNLRDSVLVAEVPGTRTAYLVQYRDGSSEVIHAAEIDVGSGHLQFGDVVDAREILINNRVWSKVIVK